MTIVVKNPQQQQRGVLSTPTAFRFRGPWSSATAYKRGDIAISPTGQLYWCGVAHTSPTTFSVGTNFSTNSPWWAPVPTNGVWRGQYSISASGYQTNYSPNDLVVDPITGQVARALYSDSAGASWTSSKFNDFGPYSPFLFIDPGVILPPNGVPQASPDIRGHGLWPRHTRIQYPRSRPIAVFHTSADFTSVTGGAVAADPDPVDPNGCPMISFSQPGSGTIALKQLGTSVNVQNCILRIVGKLSNYGGSPTVVGTLGTALSTSGAITNIPLMNNMGVPNSWVSGSNYTTNQIVADGTNGYYMALANLTNNTTAPSLDAVNWLPVYNGLQLGQAPNMQVTITDPTGAHTQTFTMTQYVSGSAGASVQQLPCNSLTPTFAFPVGSTINTVSRSGITSVFFQVSSDNFSTHASQIQVGGASATYYANGSPDTAWGYMGGGPGQWGAATGFASLADLTSINAIRFVLKSTVAGAINTYSVYKVEAIPSNASATTQFGTGKGDGKAKCVLWGDDSYAGHWTYVLGVLGPLGLPFCTATSGAIPATGSELQLNQLQYMNWFHGCQIANHYYWANDGGDNQSKDGLAKEAYIQRARHNLKAAGTWGNDFHAWHDDDHGSASNMPIIRKNFAGARGYVQGDGGFDTLPPVNPYYIRAWGVGSSDTTGSSVATTNGTIAAGTITSIPITGAGLSQNLANGEQLVLGSTTFLVNGWQSANPAATSITVQSQVIGSSIASATAVMNPGAQIKQQIDQAILFAGLIQIVWENVQSLKAELVNIAAYLDARRTTGDAAGGAGIDTVTLTEALTPWTVPAG